VGFISKRIHQQTTDRLAAPVRATVSLSVNEAYEIGKQLIVDYVPQTGFAAGWNDSLYYYRAGTREDGTLAVRAFRPKKAGQSPKAMWDAQLVVYQSDDVDYRLVELKLLRWTTKDGALELRNAYESYRDQLFLALAHVDPTLRQLS
jgi:hypothetical protein